MRAGCQGSDGAELEPEVRVQECKELLSRAEAKVKGHQTRVTVAEELTRTAEEELTAARASRARERQALLLAEKEVVEAKAQLADAAAAAKPSSKAATTAAILSRERDVDIRGLDRCPRANLWMMHQSVTLTLAVGDGLTQLKQKVRQFGAPKGYLLESLRVAPAALASLNEYSQARKYYDEQKLDVTAFPAATTSDLIMDAVLYVTFKPSKVTQEVKERGTITIHLVGAQSSASRAKLEGKSSFTVHPHTTLQNLKTRIRDTFGKVRSQKLSTMYVVDPSNPDIKGAAISKITDLKDGMTVTPTYTHASGGGYFGGFGGRGRASYRFWY